jgi:hypothetical protein
VPASIHVFASPEAAAAATLTSASISGITPDGGDDKDANSKLKFTLFVDFGGGFTQTVAEDDFQEHGRFPDGEPWGPIGIPVTGTFTIDNVTKLRTTMEFQPKGDDEWAFTYKLNLTFSDGSVISKTGSKRVTEQQRTVSL